MSKEITVPATKKGLMFAAEWIRDYAKSLPSKMFKVVDEMTMQGEMYAINLLGHIDTGETLSTIAGYRDGKHGYIVAGGNAVWIEFGTGVVANAGNAPHPKASELQMSPWGTFGKGKGANPNGWYYLGDDGEVHHTYGIPSNRFLYNTAQTLRRQYPEIAKEIFADEQY